MIGDGGDSAARNSSDTDAEADFGVLLGWTAESLGDRIVLRMQSARQRPAPGEAPREFTYFLKREQAVLLGNFLFQVAGATSPAKRKTGRLAKLLGKP